MLTQKQSGFQDFTLPIEIEGEKFTLEIKDIENIEIIDLDAAPSKGKNILQQINGMARDPKSGLS